MPLALALIVGYILFASKPPVAGGSTKPPASVGTSPSASPLSLSQSPGTTPATAPFSATDIGTGLSRVLDPILGS